MLRCLLAAIVLVSVGVPRPGSAAAQSAGQASARAPSGEVAGHDEQVRRLKQRKWEIKAERIDPGELRVDGHVDEEVWARAEPVTEFYQRERRSEGQPATERTEVRVLFDDKNLYIGFKCFDRQPDRVRARSIFRDEAGGSDDLVGVMLDAFNRDRSALQFASNANGLMEDLLQTGESESTRNINFDAVWMSRGSHTSDGYNVEMVIPFKSLRFDPPAGGQEAVFGIGFKRNIPRKNEEMIWPFVSNDSSWYRPAELGDLRGLVGIQPGRNVELRPYALGGAIHDFRLAETDGRRDAGVDLKWGVTTGLTADFTVNTDFAQEEVDVQQINFTRFSLFFPEKRQLFLEGQQMFQFGVPREADLVFTRRIGLSPGGQIMPLIGGARLSGRHGRTNIGAMSMETDQRGLIPRQNFTVLRLQRDVRRRSKIGALFTNVQGGGRFNRLVGGDASLLFNQVWSVQGFAAGMDETGSTNGAYAAYGRLGLDADRVGASYRFLDIGENFRPGVGYVQRPNSRSQIAELRVSPRPQSDVVRQFHFRGGFTYITNQHSVLETRERDVGFTTELESGDALSANFSQNLEHLELPFRLRSDVTIAPGTYRTDTFDVHLNTFRRRHTTLNLAFYKGGFWDGSRDRLSIRAGWRLSTHVGLSGNYDLNWIELPQAAFTTHLVSSRLQIALRNDLAILSLLQYNSDTRQLSTNLRFNWIPKPGTDFFIVYNELDDRVSGLAARNRSIVVKLNYLFAI